METILRSIFSVQAFGTILRVSTPLIFAALAALVSKKAGVLCIAYESVMLFAALGGVIGSAFTQNVFLGVLCGVTFGLVIAAIFAYCVLVLKSNNVLTGLALNILGSGGTVLLMYLVCGDKGVSSSLNSLVVPNLNIPLIQNIPVLGQLVSGHNIMTYVAFLCVFLSYIFIFRMPIGMRIRSVGENPNAAESVGISVAKTRFIALMAAGVLASLGGVYMSMGYLPFFSRNMVAGRGFIGIAAQNLGAGSPLGTMIASLAFGLADALSNILQSLQLPAEFMQMIPYAATLVALLIYGDGKQKKHASKKTPKNRETSLPKPEAASS